MFRCSVLLLAFILLSSASDVNIAQDGPIDCALIPNSGSTNLLLQSFVSNVSLIGCSWTDADVKFEIPDLSILSIRVENVSMAGGGLTVVAAGSVRALDVTLDGCELLGVVHGGLVIVPDEAGATASNLHLKATSTTTVNATGSALSVMSKVATQNVTIDVDGATLHVSTEGSMCVRFGKIDCLAVAATQLASNATNSSITIRKGSIVTAKVDGNPPSSAWISLVGAASVIPRDGQSLRCSDVLISVAPESVTIVSEVANVDDNHRSVAASSGIAAVSLDTSASIATIEVSGLIIRTHPSTNNEGQLISIYASGATATAAFGVAVAGNGEASAQVDDLVLECTQECTNFEAPCGVDVRAESDTAHGAVASISAVSNAVVSSTGTCSSMVGGNNAAIEVAENVSSTAMCAGLNCAVGSVSVGANARFEFSNSTVQAANASIAAKGNVTSAVSASQGQILGSDRHRIRSLCCSCSGTAQALTTCGPAACS